MMNKMSSEETKRKLRRERLEVCLNCRLFSKCKNVGKYEECGNFDEVKSEVWTIKKV